mgnify:CR=1 FL=1
MQYTELAANVQDIVENTFTDAQMAMLVRQAEQKIYNTVQIANLRKNVYGQLTANNQYLSAPTDFLSTYSLAVITDVTGGDINTGTYAYLLNKDVNFIRESYPSPNITGTPKYYALFGPTTAGSTITNELTFILGPTPDDKYQVELHFYYYPESITTAASGRTWLGDNFDTVLLYGTLVEANTFMKGEQDLTALYNQKYQEALALAKRLGDGLERSDAYRSGQFRMPNLPQNSGVV